MKVANLIQHNLASVQMEYEVDTYENKNMGIYGILYLPYSWDSNGTVDERKFLASFSSNWECDTVLSFKGEDYKEPEKDDLDIDDEDDECYPINWDEVAYYQTGGVHGLIQMTQALFMIHYVLKIELAKTNTYMDRDDNEYAKSFNILEKCMVEIIEKD